MAKKKVAPVEPLVETEEVSPTDPERKPRTLSPYNRFMKINVTKLKQENQGMAHKDAFRRAALAWANAPENPKNAKTSSAPAPAPAAPKAKAIGKTKRLAKGKPANTEEAKVMVDAAAAASAAAATAAT